LREWKKVNCVKTHVKDVYPAFIHEEALKKALDDNQALAQHKNGSIDPSPCAALEDHEKKSLRQESKREKNQIHEKRDDR